MLEAQPILAPIPQSPQETASEDDVPSWVTEFSDDAALVPNEAPAPVRPAASPQPVRAALVAIPGLEWDGNWPALAAGLPLRGVAQQLALQTELIECQHAEHATNFCLRVPFDTLRSSGNVDKLAVALSERFGRKVTVETDLGPVWHTASAQAQTEREARQRQAEHTIENDPFVLSVKRDLGATVVPGSIRPAAVQL